MHIFAKKKPLRLNIMNGKKLEQLEFVVLLLPLTIVMLVFNYLPMAGLAVAFSDLKAGQSVFDMNIIGFKWFQKLFNDSTYWRAFRNTLRISIVNLLVTFPIPIIFALLLNEIRVGPFKKFTQSASFFPYFISTVIIVQLLMNFVAYDDGLINNLRYSEGLDSINFRNLPQWFTPFYVGTGVWSGTGWSSVIYLSAMTAIDPGLYEAATLDGCGKFKQMIYITIPQIKSTIMMMLILALGSILGVGYEKTMLLSNDLIRDTTEVLATYIYRTGVVNWQLAYSTAMGLFGNIINFITLIGANYASKKLTEESLW